MDKVFKREFSVSQVVTFILERQHSVTQADIKISVVCQEQFAETDTGWANQVLGLHTDVPFTDKEQLVGLIISSSLGCSNHEMLVRS